MRQPPATSRSSKPRRTVPAPPTPAPTPSKSATRRATASPTSWIGRSTAVASVTRPCGSSATIRSASSCRSSSAWSRSAAWCCGACACPGIWACSIVIVSSEVGEVLFRPGFRAPAQVELAERLQLVEGNGSPAVQLQHRQEPGDHDALLLGADDELPEGDRLPRAQDRHDVRGLFPDADQWRVQVVEPHGGQFPRGQRERGEGGEVAEGEGPDQLRRLLPVLLLQAHRAEVPRGLLLHPALEPGCL